MDEMPRNPEQANEAGATRPGQRAGELFGRVAFLLAGAVLLATMVSCACGPVR